MIYRVLSFCFTVCVHIFYKVRYVGKTVPSQGASIIVANHPNGLLDPLMMLHLTHRPIRFLAKEPLFRMPVVGQLLKLAQALPVYRKQDGYSGSDNQSMFRTIESALKDEHCCVCLFPEGISHNLPQLQPLKTGAARIALAAENLADFQLNLQIVPVGLFFAHKSRFRSEVVVVVGDAIILGNDWQVRYQEDTFAAARELTDQIADSIKEVTVNLESWSDLPMLKFLNQLYQGYHESTKTIESTEMDQEEASISRLRMITHTYDSFMQVAPQTVSQLRTRVVQFQRLLNKLGLEADSLDQKPSLFKLTSFLLRQSIAYIIGLPLALLGMLIFSMPYQLVDWLAHKKTKDEDVVATIKVMAGIVFYPIWTLMIVLIILYYMGWKLACSMIVILPLLALYTMLFIENRGEAWIQLRIMFNSMILRSSLVVLKKERDEICIAIDQSLAQHEANLTH